MNFGVLNLIHKFNLNNTIIFSFCGFHFCFFHEQDVIFCYCILLFFFAWLLRIILWLSTQNIPPLEVFWKVITTYSILSRAMAPRDKNMSPTFSATGSAWQMSSWNISFKVKIRKFNVFIRQLQHFKKWFNQMHMYFHVEAIFVKEKTEILVFFLGKTTEEWI